MVNKKIYSNPIIIYIAGIISVTIISYITYRSHTAFKESMVAQAQQQLLTIAKMTALNVEDFITTPSAALQLMAKYALSANHLVPESAYGPPANTSMPLDIVSKIYGKGVDAVFLLDKEGRLAHIYPHRSAGEPWEKKLKELDRPAVSAVLREHITYIGTAYFNEDEELTMSVSDPVLDEQFRVIGVAQRIINIDNMAKRLIESMIMRDNASAWLFDERDVLLSYPHREFIGLGIADIIAKMHADIGEHFHADGLREHIATAHGYFNLVKSEEEGVGIFKSCKNYTDELVAYKRLELGSRRWGLVVTLPYHEIAGPINAHAKKVFGLTLVFIILFWTGGILLSQGRKRRIELEAESKYLKQIASAAEALWEGEKRFRALVENSLMGILIIREEEILYQNPEQERLFGPLPQHVSFHDFCQSVHPEDAKEFSKFYQAIISGVERTADAELRFFSPAAAGSELVWVHCRASMISYQGKKAVLINMMDITRAKELEHLVLMRQKMVSLGHVAAGIAHEIRNPLSGINIHLAALQKTMRTLDNLQDDVRQRIEKISEQLQTGSSRIEMVIRKVMDFAKPSRPQLSATDINEAIMQAIDLSTVTLRKSGIKFAKNLAAHLPPCKADRQLIEQVLLNLITNAAQAMKNMATGKELEITSLLNEGHVVITVADSGPGIPAGCQQKIFDPFFTTKSDSSGIGLSLSHRIITDHGGTLGVGVSKWGGAEFRIELPLT